MFEIIFLSLPLCIADAILSGFYGSGLLKAKYPWKITMIFWTLIYMGADILIYEIFDLNAGIIGIVINIILLFALGSAFFKWESKRLMFVALSFAAGRNLIKSITSALYYLISMVTGDLVEDMILSSEGLTMEKTELFSNIYLIIQSVICVAVYVAMLYLYLKILSRKYVYKGYELSLGESFFLIFPCVAAICVYNTLRIFVLKIGESMGVLVYDQVPEVTFWIIIICTLLLGTIIATMMLFQYLIVHNEESRKQIILENQVEQLHREIKDIEEIYSDMRGMKHDMRNHLNNIKQYVKGSSDVDTKEINGYIRQIEEAVDRLDFSSKSGNPITDIIIYQRQQEAKKQEIAFEVDFIVPASGQIDIYDIAVILNNSLDNAFEACQRKDGERQISLRSYIKGTLYFIEIENSFDGRLVFDEETGLPTTSKKDKSLHGIGLSNIRKCAQKYLGDVDIEMRTDQGEKRFVLTVMLNGKISLQK